MKLHKQTINRKERYGCELIYKDKLIYTYFSNDLQDLERNILKQDIKSNTILVIANRLDKDKEVVGATRFVGSSPLSKQYIKTTLLELKHLMWDKIKTSNK